MTPLRAVKGMNDVLPDEIGRWQRVEASFARRDGAPRLPRSPDALRRADAPLRARHRRDHRRRREGDVLLRAPRRGPHAAPRGRRPGAARAYVEHGVHNASRSPAGTTSARCSAPSVRSAGATGSFTRSAPRSSAIPGRRATRAHRSARRLLRRHRASRTSRCSSTRSADRGARAATGTRSSRTSRRRRARSAEESQRRLEHEPAAHPRLEGPARSARRGGAPAIHDVPRGRRPRRTSTALQRHLDALGDAVHGRPEARARARLLHAHALRDQRRDGEARRGRHARRRRAVRRDDRGARRAERPGDRLRGGARAARSSRASSPRRARSSTRSSRRSARRRSTRRSSSRGSSGAWASPARSTAAADSLEEPAPPRERPRRARRAHPRRAASSRRASCR